MRCQERLGGKVIKIPGVDLGVCAVCQGFSSRSTELGCVCFHCYFCHGKSSRSVYSIALSHYQLVEHTRST